MTIADDVLEQSCPSCGRTKRDTTEVQCSDATVGKSDSCDILSQLLELFAFCQERNISLPDLYREAERIADPERG